MGDDLLNEIRRITNVSVISDLRIVKNEISFKKCKSLLLDYNPSQWSYAVSYIEEKKIEFKNIEEVDKWLNK
ncbi:hypothetical protein [Anaerorhabdus furcosa]|uniref:Uncharacterized protein n=1 Tax=Anaerorhabdus furcosa TaxID=118967 RepID=A0A1T4LHX2_9FIRM|nr:hypothetical protein [Anaerorhabdus furcosa]SJZ54137.1 hypothetical protein SAMN02745191_0891 [Anaerorhabdus furcosa]